MVPPCSFGGANLAQAFSAAEREARSGGLVMVHPYDDADVIAGQGTMAAEMVEQLSDLDVLLVPIGGGGLIAGAAIAARALAPGTKVVGVQSRTYPSMVRALAGEPGVEADGLTIAEGIAVKTAGLLTRRIVQDHVDEILLVEEASIERAVALLQSVEKTVVEGAGAVGLAAMLEHPSFFAGLCVATPLTGGNMDPRMFASVIMRELARSGQLMRIEVPISDRPGALAGLSTALAGEGANIVDVAHDRMSLALNPKGAILDVVIELHDPPHGERVLEMLRTKGFMPVPRAIR